MTSTEHRNAPFLTPELWAKIFVHLGESEVGNLQPYHILDQQQHQREMHQLKLVCKQFNGIFASNFGLVQQLYLTEGFLVSSLPSLLAWLQQSKRSVRTFQSTCKSPLLEVVLAALLSSESRIKLMGICVSSACSIPVVARFTRLEKCFLANNGEHLDTADYHLDLTPLKAFSRLMDLTLEGGFKEFRGLTRLVLVEASIWDVQEFAPNLQHLHATDSSLVGTHTHGLSVCTALTLLVLSNARLMDNEW